MIPIRLGRAIACASLVCLASAGAAKADYDATSDFSIASNPNGVWTYGQTATLNGAFTAFTASSSPTGFLVWQGNSGFPVIDVNQTGTAFQIGTVFFNINQLTMHPGPGGEYGDLCFAAPAAGQYAISATFQGADVVGTTTDDHILLNGSSLFSGSVNGFGPSTLLSYSATLTLAAGDLLDLKVGFGNGSYTFDSTAVTLHITPLSVPEPASLLLLALGAGSLAAFARRRRGLRPSRSEQR